MFDNNLYGDPAMKREGISIGGPSKPEIDGPLTGKPGVDYDYKFMSIHPSDVDIYYYIIWGDGHIQDWIGPYPAGKVITLNHTFTTKGTYKISAKAKDIYDVESDYGHLYVTMPRSRFLNNFITGKILEFFQIILSL